MAKQKEGLAVAVLLLLLAGGGVSACRYQTTLAVGGRITASSNPNCQITEISVSSPVDTILKLQCQIYLQSYSLFYLDPNVTLYSSQVLTHYTDTNTIYFYLWKTFMDSSSLFYCELEAMQAITPTSCRCGVTEEGRIVNGTAVVPNTIPWQVGLERHKGSGNIFCGGGLINHKWVLTAAHCLTEFPVEEMFVILGILSKSDIGTLPAGAEEDIASVIPHAEYNAATVDNDIGLVELATPITFSASIQPICLPYAYTSEDLQGETVTVAGWGTTSFQGSTSDDLLMTDLVIQPLTVCKEAYPGNVTDSMFCTYKKGTDACQGDSGGPAGWHDGSKTYLIGVVSWGRGCAQPGNPGMLTEVSKFLGWIEEKVGGPPCGPT